MLVILAEFMESGVGAVPVFSRIVQISASFVTPLPEKRGTDV